MTELIREAAGRRVSVSDIKPGMTLARDVVTVNGAILLAKNTVLNNINHAKLLANGIEYIYISSGDTFGEPEDLSKKERRLIKLEQQRQPVEERPEFLAFQATVNEKTEEAKKCIRAISAGGSVDIQYLFSITDSIMNTLIRKNDILTFIGFIKETDEHTYHHCVNVSMLSNLYGRWAELPQKDLMELTAAGMLHDIGKTQIPDAILNKKGKLTSEEFAVIKKHPVYGYHILRRQDIPEGLKAAVLTHHEKLDGSGYPLGLKDERIGWLAKIITICDIYDAMTENRAYRGKICPFTVIHMFEEKAYGELDPQYLLTFLNNIASTYAGDWVRLSGGALAEVAFINPTRLSRPIVRTLDGEFIDLSENTDISIDSLVCG